MFLLLKGFDEYMNIVLDNAAEVNIKTRDVTPIGEWESGISQSVIGYYIYKYLKVFFYLYFMCVMFVFEGRILLKGDCITLMQRATV